MQYEREAVAGNALPRRAKRARGRVRGRGAASAAGTLLLSFYLFLFAVQPAVVGAEGPGAAPGESPKPAPLVLVTPEEIAALPNDVPVAALVKGEENGPVIHIESPENRRKYNGPFPIRVEFREGPEGLPVDMASLKLEYKKAWGIDITDRVRAYVTGTRIDVAESKLPRGRHTVDILISDTGGNRSSRRFSVTVE